MLLPLWCGRCFNCYSILQLFVLADVIAKWQMEWPHVAVCLFCFFGQMLLPCGRWNSHYLLFLFVMAGVIAHWQMELPLQGVSASLLVGVVPRGQMDWVIYLNFSSEVLCRISSHIWGRWYLPMFLFRDGLFTLMYNASLIHLQRFWSSLPTMLKLSMVTLWPVVL